MNSERSPSVSDARGQVKDFGRLSDLHPDGFSHVPRALLRHPEAQAVHIGVFAAVAETARGLPQPTGGHRWLATGVSRARLHELTGIRKADTLRAKIRELEAWGFLLEVRRPNAPSDFEILTTASVGGPANGDVTPHSPAIGLPVERVVQAAPKAHQGGTKDDGAPDNGALHDAPPTHDARTFETGVPAEGAVRRSNAHSADFAPPVEQAPALPEHRTSAPPVDRTLPSYTEKRLEKTCRCAEPHPPFITHPQYMVLKKTNKRRFVDAAIEEVAFRLGNPSIASEIRQPYTMVRNIAECYSDRCRTTHGDLHGERALMYHRGRRADVEQLLRSKGGPEPDPASLGPLQSILDEIFAESAAVLSEGDGDLEGRRAHFISALQRMQQEERSR